MYSILDNLAKHLSRLLALIGGAVLIVIVIATCISITGRALTDFGFSPIKGIFDYTEMGVGFAIFSFLPWCQYQRGHATVDLFTPFYPAAMNRVLDVIIDIAMFIAASLIAWRLWLGMLDKMRYGETTFIAQVQVWPAFAAGLVGAVLFAFVAAFCILRSGRTLISGEPANV